MTSSRTRRAILAAAIAIPLLVLLASVAAASWNPQYFIFDRMAWSPDGKTLGVIGRYWNRVSGESFEDTLTVDPATGAITCVSPSALEIALSRDGRRILLRGRWGLYDHDLVTGATRQLMNQHPFQPIQIVNFAYDREVSAAMVIRCNDWDATINGVYRLPLDASEPVRMRSDEACSAPLLNYFQTHSRGTIAIRRALPGMGHPASPERFPGTIWQVETEGGVPSLAVWGNAEAGSDTLCHDCRPEFLAWPPGGGPILMASCPVDMRNVVGPGQLWLIRPGRETESLGSGRFDSCIWADSTLAYVVSRPSGLERVDAGSGTMTPVGLSMTPDWLSDRILPVPQVWTVRLVGEIHTLADSASAVFHSAGPILGGTKGTGWSLLRQPDPKRFEITIGSFDDSAGAVGLARKLATAGFRSGPVSGYQVLRRPIHEMLGEFQFGSIQSPDGSWRAWFKTHPHLVQPCMSTELWIEPKGGRPRPILEGMATF